MRVLINWQASLGQKTGIGRYVAELVPALQALLGPEETVDGFPQGWLRALYAWRGTTPPALSGTAGAGPVSLLGRLKKSVISRIRQFIHSRLNRSFHDTLRHGRYDLYHEPNNVPMPCDTPTITTLHDLSVLLYPHWHPASRVAHYEQSFQGVRECVHILTVSNAVRQEIIDELGFSAQRVTAVHNGVNPALRPVEGQELTSRLKALRLPERYLLCVGTLEPRKNQLMLLHAYVRLPSTLRERYPLLMVGGFGWGTDEIAHFLRTEGRSRGVIHLGYLPDGALPAVYSGARALLFPSFYEGFGLPPLEMQACGGAVISSTAAALREVLEGSPAHLIDPNDGDGWYEAMARVCTDDDWWAGLRLGAERAARRFTWQNCAAQTREVYRKVIGRPAQSPLRRSA